MIDDIEIKHRKSGAWIELGKVLSDMISREAWEHFRDWNKTKLNLRTVDNIVWVKYEYALDLMEYEMQWQYGTDPILKELEEIEKAEAELMKKYDMRVKELNANARNHAKQNLIERKLHK